MKHYGVDCIAYEYLNGDKTQNIPKSLSVSTQLQEHKYAMQTNYIFDLQKLGNEHIGRSQRRHIQLSLSNNMQESVFTLKFPWMLKMQLLLFARAVTVAEEIPFNAFVLDLPWLL